MLSQIVDTRELEASLKKLRSELRRYAYREQNVVWGFPSGAREEFSTFVLRARSHDIYVGIGDGTGRPGTYSHLFRLVEHNAGPTSAFSPDLEVNISLTGSKGSGGLFAIEGERLVLCRRAMFNAYRGRIKEEDALQFFGDHAVPVQSGNRERRVLPVVALDSANFVYELEDFVERVLLFKDYSKTDPVTAGTKRPQPNSSAIIWPWNDSVEFEGVKSLEARAPVSYEYLHGPLCNRLSTALRTWAGERFDVRSTRNIDSAIVAHDGIARVIFEVKTSGSLSDQLYKAVGQLLHYRWKRGDEQTLLSLVLPAEVREEAGHASIFLGTQGINVVYEVAPNRYAMADGAPLEVFLDQHLCSRSEQLDSTN